jgi:RHS repeat-associated protein
MEADNSFRAWHGGGLGMDDVMVSSDGFAHTYHLRDILSTVIAQADGTGTASASFSYLPYGNSPQAGDPFGFTGRIHQTNSGLIYYRARFYDPGVGRFITRDRFKINHREPRRYNSYAYALNNPVNVIDPTGHEDECPYGAWTGFTAGGEAHLVLGAAVTSISVCCDARLSLCCGFLSVAGSAGVEASASLGAQVIQFFNCPDSDAIAGWGGGISGEIAVGGGVNAGASVGVSGCVALSGGVGVGVGGGISIDFGYTWTLGCDS